MTQNLLLNHGFVDETFRVDLAVGRIFFIFPLKEKVLYFDREKTNADLQTSTP